jgi:hypothetical protein
MAQDDSNEIGAGQDWAEPPLFAALRLPHPRI